MDKNEKKFGAVYTPEKLSEFIAKLSITEFLKENNNNEISILDPACGDGSLIKGISNIINGKSKNKLKATYQGIDIDNNAITIGRKRFDKNVKLTVMDSIMPMEGCTYQEGWENIINKKFDIIISNPPWGAEILYSKDKLKSLGYVNIDGQIDSYYLFIEICYSLLKGNGVCIMIIPDSIFGDEATNVRKYLLYNTEIKLIARLGEKIFEGINRSTALVMFKKNNDKLDYPISCFRLDSNLRNKYLKNEITLEEAYKINKHKVFQSRFKSNKNFNFDIDIKEEEINLINKIELNSIDWEKSFINGRGVEISKSGDIVKCNKCDKWQGASKKQIEVKGKKCVYCGVHIDISENNTDKLVERCYSKKYDTKLLVGENIKRYSINDNRFIAMGYKGINYKDDKIYSSPKILIRKTGLGINAVIDNNKNVISQTIYYYILKNNSSFDLEYILGVLNSRVIFYYYLKKFGENEWKSHPYLTHSIIKELPIKEVNETNREITKKISNLVRDIDECGYSYQKDLQIEKLVIKLYDINYDEIKLIVEEINNLPDLDAINQMKVKMGVFTNV